MQLAFWSNYHGQTTTTTSMAALAIVMALKYPLKILVTHVHAANDSLEKCFFNDYKTKRSLSIVESNGIDTLIRMVKNHKLTADQLSNYTIPVFKNSKLDILIGTSNPDEKLFYENISEILHIFKLAEKSYDLILIDAPSGLLNAVSADLLKSVSGTVVCLNQNKHVLDGFFHSEDFQALRSGKPLLCLGRYDSNLSMTEKNIKRYYGAEHVMRIDQSSEIQEAINHSRLVHYFARHMDAHHRSTHYGAVQSVLKSSQALLKYYGLLKSV